MHASEHSGIHLSYRWPNCATLSGLLCCCRLSIYTSAASDISGKLREPTAWKSSSQRQRLHIRRATRTRRHTPRRRTRPAPSGHCGSLYGSPCLRKPAELKLRRSASTSVGSARENVGARRCVPGYRESTIPCKRQRCDYLSIETSRHEGAKIVTEVGSLGTISEHTKTPTEYRTRVMYTVESRGHEQSKRTDQHPEDSIGGTHTC
jgi:hypothetical protein